MKRAIAMLMMVGMVAGIVVTANAVDIPLSTFGVPVAKQTPSKDATISLDKSKVISVKLDNGSLLKMTCSSANIVKGICSYKDGSPFKCYGCSVSCVVNGKKVGFGNDNGFTTGIADCKVCDGFNKTSANCKELNTRSHFGEGKEWCTNTKYPGHIKSRTGKTYKEAEWCYISIR